MSKDVPWPHSTLCCNGCATDLSNTKNIITACGHLFCKSCVNSSNKRCRVCGQKLSQSTLRIFCRSDISDDDLRKALVGFPPPQILEATQHALAFWDSQQQLQRNQLRGNMESAEQNWATQRGTLEKAVIEANSKVSMMETDLRHERQRAEAAQRRVSELESQLHEKQRSISVIRSMFGPGGHQQQQPVQPQLQHHPLSSHASAGAGQTTSNPVFSGHSQSKSKPGFLQNAVGVGDPFSTPVGPPDRSHRPSAALQPIVQRPLFAAHHTNMSIASSGGRLIPSGVSSALRSPWLNEAAQAAAQRGQQPRAATPLQRFAPPQYHLYKY